MVTVLNQAGNYNQMNGFGNVPGMIQGNGFGNLGATGQGYLNQNTVFMPTMGSPMPQLNTLATLYNRRAGSLASAQAISSTMLANSNVILTGLRALQQLIDTQPSSQLMGGMNGRLAAYQGNINSQQYQLSQMQAFASAQEKVFDEQEKQAVFCSDYHWVNDTKSLTGAGLNIGGTGNCAIGAAATPLAGNVGIGAPAAGGAGLGTTGTAVPAATVIDTGNFDTPVNPPIPATAASTGAFDTPVETQIVTNAR
jgi:hypothetical protein